MGEGVGYVGGLVENPELEKACQGAFMKREGAYQPEEKLEEAGVVPTT
jgi:hypothetical protein